MPWGLKRCHQSRDLHFITFSCHRRKKKLGTPAPRRIFEQALERARRQYDFYICGYVVMPEHVHLLVSEPEKALLSTAIQSLKQGVARRLLLQAPEPFWQARYYDFNVWSEKERIEKLRYMHRNPVKRGLVEKPEDWEWSSFRHCVSGERGIVEIESEWTARRREWMGIRPVLKPYELPRPSNRS
jgi:putative transposase